VGCFNAGDLAAGVVETGRHCEANFVEAISGLAQR
jgi:hypothetical protein